MRSLKLARMLLIAALLVVPAAVGAERGTGGNGYVWDGASDWPGVTSITIPEALPETGGSINGFIWDGASYVPDLVPSEAPVNLPETGFDRAGSLRKAYAQLRHDGSVEPSALPESGFDWASALREMGYDRASALRDAYAQLRHDGSVEPSALPETGFDWDRALREAYAQLRHDGSVAPAGLPETGATGTTIDGFVWDGSTYVPHIVPSAQPPVLPETGASRVSFDLAAALRDAYAQLRSTGEVAPASLPLTGSTFGLAGRDRQVIADQMAASSAARVWMGSPAQPAVNLDGITGRDRQTIIDQLAASGVRVTISQPAALPQTGHSAAGNDTPSDPPLIGDWALTAATVEQEDAMGIPSDPPLLGVSGLR